MSLETSAAIDKGTAMHRRAIATLERLRSTSLQNSDSRVIEFHDINVFDVLVTAIYLEFLEQAPASASLVERVKGWIWQKLTSSRDRSVTELESTKDRIAPTSVVFWPTDTTHITAQLPVAEALPEELSQVFCASSFKTRAELNASGVRNVVSTAIWPELAEQAADETKRRFCQHQRYRRTHDTPEERRLGEVVSAQLYRAIYSVLVAERLVDTMRPEVMVVGNDLTVEGRAAALVASRRNVRSVVLAHGSVLENSTHGLHVADIVTAYGEFQRRTLVQLGVKENHIRVTGAPYLDKLQKQTGTTDPALTKQLNLSADRPWVLVATSGPGHVISVEQHTHTVRALIRACEQLPDIDFIVKLHRKDHPRYYRDLSKPIRSRFHVIRHGSPGFPTSIFDWLQGCSAILTGGSTVAIEAMLVDVPVITMDFTDELNRIPFVSAGATIHIRSEQELLSALERVAIYKNLPIGLTKRVAEYLSGEFSMLDGNASERVVDVINQMCRQKPTRLCANAAKSTLAGAQ